MGRLDVHFDPRIAGFSRMTHVRPLAASDKPEWVRLWRAYLAFYQTELDDAIYDTFFQRLLGDDPQDFHGLIALKWTAKLSG